MSASHVMAYRAMLALFVAFVVEGCGSERITYPERTTPTRLTRAEFKDQANSICDDINGAAASVLQKNNDLNKTMAEIVLLHTRGLRDLQALRPPSRIVGRFTMMLKTLTRRGTLDKQLTWMIREQTPVSRPLVDARNAATRRALKLAGELGLVACPYL